MSYDLSWPPLLGKLMGIGDKKMPSDPIDTSIKKSDIEAMRRCFVPTAAVNQFGNLATTYGGMSVKVSTNVLEGSPLRLMATDEIVMHPADYAKLSKSIADATCRDLDFRPPIIDSQEQMTDEPKLQDTIDLLIEVDRLLARIGQRGPMIVSKHFECGTISDDDVRSGDEGCVEGERLVPVGLMIDRNGLHIKMDPELYDDDTIWHSSIVRIRQFEDNFRDTPYDEVSRHVLRSGLARNLLDLHFNVQSRIQGKPALLDSINRHLSDSRKIVAGIKVEDAAKAASDFYDKADSFGEF